MFPTITWPGSYFQDNNQNLTSKLLAVGAMCTHRDFEISHKLFMLCLVGQMLKIQMFYTTVKGVLRHVTYRAGHHDRRHTQAWDGSASSGSHVRWLSVIMSPDLERLFPYDLLKVFLFSKSTKTTNVMMVVFWKLDVIFVKGNQAHSLTFCISPVVY